MHDALAGPVSGSQAPKLGDARIHGVELAELALQPAEAGIHRECAEHRLELRLEAVDLGGVGIVELEAEYRDIAGSRR